MESSDFNDMSMLSWGSGQTKDDISQNHFNDTNFNYNNDDNLLSETIQEFDDEMGNTNTESIISDEIEIEKNMDEIINTDNEIENELNNNVEIISIEKNTNEKDNTINNNNVLTDENNYMNYDDNTNDAILKLKMNKLNKESDKNLKS